ncbi:hypothetical protein A2U01_0033007 [Trifolium medium]|uniref:Uncharacterized protein n=1 Tax=Trifolium medium TaxID=97028 RepID=A0A392PJB5_9FABA|nr:hypothetical protein [Trifolium medium]
MARSPISSAAKAKAKLMMIRKAKVADAIADKVLSRMIMMIKRSMESKEVVHKLDDEVAHKLDGIIAIGDKIVDTVRSSN